VVVTDQLDGTKVDLSTITFGPVNYGTNAITPPAGSSGFTKTYVPPGVTNYVVRVQGSADQNTGLVKWTFTTIDPATNLPPSDPTVGFLPPDVDGVVGQGGVTFNVMPLGTPATGTAIPNGASVVFDANAAIATPVWTNMICAAECGCSASSGRNGDREWDDGELSGGVVGNGYGLRDQDLHDLCFR
jgi:hypothetical protein